MVTLLVAAFIYIYSKMWEALGPGLLGLCLKRALSLAALFIVMC